MKIIKNWQLFKEDVYYPAKENKYSLKEFKPTDRQVEHVESQLCDEYNKQLNINLDKESWAITSIEYYAWDDDPRWFVFLQNDAGMERRMMKLRGEVDPEYRERTFNTPKGRETFEERISRLRKLSRYKEIDVWVDHRNAYDNKTLWVQKAELAGHGYPVMSTDIWKYDFEKELFPPGDVRRKNK